MDKTPNQQQKDLYAFIAQHAPISADKVNFHLCKIPTALSLEHWVAYTDIGPSGSHSTLIVSLPEHSNQVYIAITDHFHPAFYELIAHFDAESESNDALEIFSSMRLKNPFFNQAGWHAILFAHVVELIEDFPQTAIINNEHYFFKLVTCLTESEFEFAQRLGSIALLQELYRQRRNFLKFIQPNWKFISNKTDTMAPIKGISYGATATQEKSAQQEHYLQAIRASIQQQQKQHKLEQPVISQDSQLTQTIEFIVTQVLNSLGINEEKRKIKNSTSHTKLISQQNSIKGFKLSPIGDKILTLSEIILGLSLLIGGLAIGFLLANTRFPAASIFPGIFAIAGVITLISAYLSRKN